MFYSEEGGRKECTKRSLICLVPFAFLFFKETQVAKSTAISSQNVRKLIFARIARFSSPERVVQWQDIPGKGRHWRRRRRSQLPGRHAGTFQIRYCCFLESFSIESIGGRWKRRRLQLARWKSNNSEARHSSEAWSGNILVSVFLCWGAWKAQDPVLGLHREKSQGNPGCQRKWTL